MCRNYCTGYTNCQCPHKKSKRFETMKNLTTRLLEKIWTLQDKSSQEECMMTAAIRVLYVDDEHDLLDIGKLFLEESGDFTVTTAISASIALRLLEQEKFDAIIADYQMPGMNGIQFLVEVRTRFGPTPFILFTGRGREEVVIQAINSGADFYLQKGGEPGAQFAELKQKIKSAAFSKRADDALHESEEKYRHLIEHSNEAIVVVQDGMPKMVNHQTIEFTGYSEQELLSMSISAFIHPDDRAMVMERYQKRMKGEEGPSRYSFRLSSKDGSTRWIEISVSAIDWERRPATLNFLTDITERKQVEEELKFSERKFAAAFEASPDPIAITEIQNGTILNINSAFEEWSGYLQEEMSGKTTRDLNFWISPEERDTVVKILNLQGIVHKKEVTFKKKSGDIRNILFSAKVFGTEDKNYMLSLAEDITERKLAEKTLLKNSEELHAAFEELTATEEELRQNVDDLAKSELALRESEEKFRSLAESSPDYIMRYDRQCRHTYMNPSALRVAGLTNEQIIGKTHSESGFDEAQSRFYEDKITGVFETGKPFQIQFAWDSVDGHVVLDWMLTPEFSKDKTVQSVLGISRDITQLKKAEEELLKKNEELGSSYEQVTAAEEELRANLNELARQEQALRESEERYRLINDASLDFIFSYDTSGRFTSANRNLCASLRLRADQIVGRTHAELGFPDAQCRDWDELHRRVLKTGTTVTDFTSTPMPDGIIRHYEVVLNPLHDSAGTITGIAGTTRDITERKVAEEAIRQANRKLTLLTGITRHDINNQLTVLQGYLDILESKQSDPTLNEYFSKVSIAAQRIASMIQFTKEYEKIGVNTPVWQNCRKLVDIAAKEAPLGKIVVKNDLPVGTEVFADPLVVKVCYNLMDNAARYGGKITTLRFSVEISSDDHLIVCEDDGDGVVAMEKEKIFERGFGKNTGLGLALSREILSITGITIRETGEPGKSARFEITVPKGAWRIAGKNT